MLVPGAGKSCHRRDVVEGRPDVRHGRVEAGAREDQELQVGGIFGIKKMIMHLIRY